MKRLISLLLCLTLVLLVVAVPVNAATDDKTVKNTLGRYYCFSFEDGNNHYDYNAIYNKPLSYKGSEFYPFWCYTDKTVAAETAYTTLDDGTEHGLDVLQIKAPGTVYFTPLSADGKPFEAQAGKTYVVKMTAYIETEVAWSQCYMNFGVGHTRIKENDEYYTNSSRAYVKGTAGSANAAGSKATASNIANRPVSASGFTKNNGNNWAQGVKGTSTTTASKVTATEYFTIPADGTNGMVAEYDATNDALTLHFPKYVGNSMTEPMDQDKDGNQDVTDSTNYFSFMFNGGTYTDADGAFGEKGKVYPFTYDIASLEIWEDGYTPDLEFVVNGETVKTVDGADRANPGWFVPEAPADQYFTGWYSNAACTKLINTEEALAPSVTKAYAGFRKYDAGITVDFSAGANMDGKISYPTYNAEATPAFSSTVSRVGWETAVLSGGALQMYARAAWTQGGAYLLSDMAGNAFVAKPNTTYTIVLEYKVDLIDPDAVGTLPDGSHYSAPTMQFQVGFGMPLARRGSLNDKEFTYKTSMKKVSENTGWVTETFTVTTGDMAGQIPVAGIYGYCYGLPYRYSGSSKQDGNTGDSSYGYNMLSVRKMTIIGKTNLNFVDEQGNQLNQFAQDFGEPVDFAAAESGADIIRPDGTGYSVATYQWYEDAAMTKPVNVAQTTVPAAETTYYAKTTRVLEDQGNQVSYYGFDDLWYSADKGKISGYTLETGGYHSAQSLKATSTAGAIDVTPNVALDDAVDYAATFWYKATKPVTVTVGGTQKTLDAVADWTAVSLPVRSVKGRVALTLDENNGTFCLDDIGVYRVVYKGGASVLTDDAEKIAGTQALRVYYSYFTENGGINTGAADHTVTERGIVLIRGDAGDAATLNCDTDGATVVRKSADLDNCWDYSNGCLTYSACVNNFRLNDSRALLVRGYVVLEDGHTYYSDATVYTVADVKEMIALASLHNTYSFTDAEVLDKVVLDARYVVTDQGVTYDWTGATLRMNVKSMGKLSLRMLVQPSKMENHTYLTVYMDGQRINRRFVVPVDSLEEKEYTFELFVGGDNRTHTVEIARQNEAGMATMVLCDVTINGTLETAEKKNYLVEFIGDSITCGQGDLTTVARDPAGAPYSDGTSAYAFLAARALDVDYRMVSGSGRGVIYSSGGGTGVGASWLATYGVQNDRRSKTEAYVSNRAADVVCIYLGTNDCYGRSINSNVNFTDQELVDKMGELINVVRSYNPGAKIVWISGGITRSYEELAETAIANAGGAANGCYMFKFSKTGLQSGGAWHPTGENQAEMGAELAAFLQESHIIDNSLF